MLFEIFVSNLRIFWLLLIHFLKCCTLVHTSVWWSCLPIPNSTTGQ